VLKLLQRVINGIFATSTTNSLITADTQCAACGNMPNTLTTIMLGNDMWLVCDTDKCKRKILSERIIQLV
jgi:alpha-D-ribose 1-methylphosphonate 5-phosphate C-P lyase